MKSIFTLMLLAVCLCLPAFAQDNEEDQDGEYKEYREYSRKRNWDRDNGYRINTIFNNYGPRASGGYLAMTNKFTTINGDFANMVELYGGWYINHKVLLGLEMAATTNNIPVPYEHSTSPLISMSYEYGQAGLMTEYVVASDRAVHLSFQFFAGAGFTLQYPRYDWKDNDYWNNIDNIEHDENWFFVTEPGVKIEVNVFRWLRLCPGVSYRKAHNSQGRGLPDKSIDGTSVNMTVKIGRF
jgi:hypothetical protein